MSEKVVFGEIDWNSGDTQEVKEQTDFMRLSQGKNRVRVMGNPVQFYIHWVDTPDGKKKKFNSPISDQALVRKLEDADFKRKPRWMIKVLDRSDNKFKLLEIGSQIYNGIKALYLDEDWGPVTQYDITIVRGAPGSQPLYRVTPSPKQSLESDLKSAYMSFNDRVDLTKLTKPADPDTVREIMGWSGSTKVAATDDLDDDLFEF